MNETTTTTTNSSSSSSSLQLANELNVKNSNNNTSSHSSSSSSSSSYTLSKNLRFNLNNFKLASLINISSSNAATATKFDMTDLKLNGIKYKPQAWHEDNSAANHLISNYKVTFPQFSALKTTTTTTSSTNRNSGMHKKTSSSPAPPSQTNTTTASAPLSVPLSSMNKPDTPLPATAESVDEARPAAGSGSQEGQQEPAPGQAATKAIKKPSSSNEMNNANSTRLSNGAGAAATTGGEEEETASCSSIYFSPINGSSVRSSLQDSQQSVGSSSSSNESSANENENRLVVAMPSLNSSTGGVLCALTPNNNNNNSSNSLCSNVSTGHSNSSRRSSGSSSNNSTPTSSYLASNSDDINSDQFQQQQQQQQHSMSLSITKEESINLKLSKRTTTTTSAANRASSKAKSTSGEKAKTTKTTKSHRRHRTPTDPQSEDSKSVKSAGQGEQSTAKKRRSKASENHAAKDFNLMTGSLIDLTTTSVSAGQLKDMNDYFYVSSEEFIESLNCDSTCANQSQHNHKNLKHNRSYLSLSGHLNNNNNNMNAHCNGVECHSNQASEEHRTTSTSSSNGGNTPSSPGRRQVELPAAAAAAALPIKPAAEEEEPISQTGHVSRHVRHATRVNEMNDENMLTEIFSWFAELAYVLITNFKYWCIFTITSICFLILFATKFFILSIFSIKNIGTILLSPFRLNLIYMLACRIIRMPLSLLDFEASSSSPKGKNSMRNALSSKSRSSSNLNGHKQHHLHHHPAHHHHHTHRPRPSPTSPGHSPTGQRDSECCSYPARSLQNINLSGGQRKCYLGEPVLRCHQSFGKNDDALKLYKAMKSLGTDESTLISIFCERNGFQK